MELKTNSEHWALADGSAIGKTRAGVAPAVAETGGSAYRWHALSSDQVLSLLGVTGQGLDTAEVLQRRERHGPNALPATRQKTIAERFVTQLNNLLIFVLLGSAAITALLGQAIDTVVILAVVLLNAVIGLVQEGRAARALDAIRSMISPHASVLRSGQRWEVDAAELVPGDILLLEAGDRVAADARLIKARGLRVDEAVLTGESVAVDKSVEPVDGESVLGDQASMVFSGTFVAAGHAQAVVVATGTDSELGRITSMMGRVEDVTTPLIRKMNGFARQLSFAILLLCAVTLLFGIFVRGLSVADAFMAVVGMAVAAIPEGLPAVMTITLAIGVQRMAERNAIIRQLPAVETLGSVGVICTDKTGTLTLNEMSVQAMVTASATHHIEGVGYRPSGEVKFVRGEDEIASRSEASALARAAILCNDAELFERNSVWRVQGDPMEGALLAFGGKVLGQGIAKAANENDGKPLEQLRILREAHRRVDEVPFDAAHRFMATLHEVGSEHPCGKQERRLVIVKGAPERLLDMCDTQLQGGDQVGLDRAYWEAQVEACAADGQRTLMFAQGRVANVQDEFNVESVGEGLTLIGLVGLIDPPREEAVRAVADVQSAGIRVKMITGDHAATAAAIAAQIGLKDAGSVVSGREFNEIPDEDLPGVAAGAGVFARTSPEQKLRLVEALQRDGSVIAMTGDGVNDAPALKRADVGIAMGRKGTEAAKEAAAVVLADDNFASIAAAVREGRAIYDNLTKVIGWTLPTSFGETVVIMLAILLGLALPVTPVQILWVNMVTAVGLGLVLAFEPPEAGIMSRRPRSPHEPLLSRVLVWQIVFVSALFVVGCFGVYQWALSRGLDQETARTMVVNTLVVMEIFYLFSIRTLGGTSFSREAIKGTPAVLIGVGTVTALQLAFTYLPALQSVFETRALTMAEGAVVFAIGIVLFVIVEIEKMVRGPVIALVRSFSR